MAFGILLCSDDLRTGPISGQRPDRIKTGPARFSQPAGGTHRTAEGQQSEGQPMLRLLVRSQPGFASRRLSPTRNVRLFYNQREIEQGIWRAIGPAVAFDPKDLGESND